MLCFCALGNLLKHRSRFLIWSKQRGVEKEEDGTVVKIQSFTSKTRLLDILLNKITMNCFSVSFSLQYKVLRCAHKPAFNEDRARPPISSKRITVRSIARFCFFKRPLLLTRFELREPQPIKTKLFPCSTFPTVRISTNRLRMQENAIWSSSESSWWSRCSNYSTAFTV